MKILAKSLVRTFCPLHSAPPALGWTEGYQLILKSRDEAELSLVPGAVQNICKINLKLAKIMTSS